MNITNYLEDITGNLTDNQFNKSTNLTTQNEEMNIETFLMLVRKHQIESFYGSLYYRNFVATMVFCILGYITNVFNILVFSRTTMLTSLNMFLMTIAVSDIILITTQFAHIIHWLNGFKLYPFYEGAVFFLVNGYIEDSFLSICCWLVAVTGIWRLISATRPLQAQKICSRYRAKVILILIYVISLSLSTTSFVQFTFASIKFQGLILYNMEFSAIARSPDQIFLKFVYVAQLFKGLLPLLVMLISTILLIGQLYIIRKRTQKELNVQISSIVNFKISVMLVTLLIFYFLSNFVDSFMFLLYLCNKDLHEKYSKATESVKIFSCINNSASFFIYYSLSKEFRETFHAILRRCFPLWRSATKERDPSSPPTSVIDTTKL